MVKSVELGKELVVTEKNRVGILADMAKKLADGGINIEGVAGYAMKDEAKIMLVAEDSLRAKEILAKGGYKSVKENEVIVVELENRPGALKGVTSKLASAKIDIKYIYGTACPAGCPARIVLSTVDNEKTLVLLKAK
jgi:hypothetical protein